MKTNKYNLNDRVWVYCHGVPEEVFIVGYAVEGGVVEYRVSFIGYLHTTASVLEHQIYTEIKEDSIMKDFKVFDKVWLMDDNKPVQMKIISVVHKAIDNNKVETYYDLIGPSDGVSWCNAMDIIVVRGSDVFRTKEGLCKKVFK